MFQVPQFTRKMSLSHGLFKFLLSGVYLNHVACAAGGCEGRCGEKVYLVTLQEEAISKLCDDAQQMCSRQDTCDSSHTATTRT